MNRDFKGIWIPREIWLAKGIGIQEKCLWAEIHSLFDREKGGCFASNEYLCDFLGVKERRLQEMMANLKTHGWVVQVSFDGRSRVIKAVIPSEQFTPELKDDVDCAEQRCTKVHPRDAEKCTSQVSFSAPPIYGIDKSLEKSIDPLLKVPKGTEERVDFSHEVKETAHAMVDSMRMVKPDYAAANGKLLGMWNEIDRMMRLDKRDPGKILEVFRWALADNFWADKMFKPNPAKYLREKFDQLEMKMIAKPVDPNKVDRRTKNMDGTPVDRPEYKGRF